MKTDVQKEASVASGIKGFSAPFGAKPAKRQGKKKKNPSKPYDEPELFENAVAMALLEDEDDDGDKRDEGDDVEEVVRKRGASWALFDDDTGAEIGSFKDRETAWERQRTMRLQRSREKAMKSAETKRQIQALTPVLAPKAQTQRSVVQAKTPKRREANPAQTTKDTNKAKQSLSKKTKRERIERIKKLFTEELKEKKQIQERSMISYVFENTPVSDDSSMWDKFVGRLSRETVMSDPKLKKILQNMAKAEAKMLGKAVDVVGFTLKSTGSFEVKRGNVDQDSKTGDIKINFDVKLKDNDVVLSFAIKLENGRPLILFPDESRRAINNLANNESKLLRAELMHAQETELDRMDDVIAVSSKRNSYLQGMEEQLDKLLVNMAPLEIAMLKYLMKNKYKGTR